MILKHKATLDTYFLENVFNVALCLKFDMKDNGTILV